MIDDATLVQELELEIWNVHLALINCIKAFLGHRAQAVRKGNKISGWKTPKGGISQGTKLGVILFTIMTNSLLHNWNLRIKLVNDTTAIEIIPRNGISLLNFPANDILAFSRDHTMKLNPSKCKEMLINFMIKHNFVINPISLKLGDNIIEETNVYKRLGVYISRDMKWNNHMLIIFSRRLIRDTTPSEF